jgi:hypothetical protein
MWRQRLHSLPTGLQTSKPMLPNSLPVGSNTQPTPKDLPPKKLPVLHWLPLPQHSLLH